MNDVKKYSPTDSGQQTVALIRSLISISLHVWRLSWSFITSRPLWLTEEVCWIYSSCFVPFCNVGLKTRDSFKWKFSELLELHPRCVCLHVKCPSLLPAFNQNWNVSINVSKTCVIAGLYRGVNFFALLGCYAAYVGDVTDVSGQHMCSISLVKQSWLLKMGPMGCPERSVTNY